MFADLTLVLAFFARVRRGAGCAWYIARERVKIEHAYPMGLDPGLPHGAWCAPRGGATLVSDFDTQEIGMRTILIAHRDADFADELATELRAWGYRVIECPGPLPPALRCIRCDKGYCPLTEGADLMMYDPHLTACDETGQPHNLAIDSALAHQDVPMLLAWSSSSVPDAGTLRAIHAAAPWVHVAAREPRTLRGQIHDLLATAAVTP